MYTAVSLIGVPKGINKVWTNIPLVTTLASLYTQYRKIYAELRIDAQVQTVWLDLDKLIADQLTSTQTLAQFLTANGNNALATQTTKPVIDHQFARYSDGWKANYRVLPIHPQYGINVPEEQRSALLITREGSVDYTKVRNNVLFTVNGFVHMADTDGQSGVMLYEAGNTYLKTKQAQFGLLSFLNMGGIECVPITADMIHKRLSPAMIAGTQATEPYSKNAYLTLNKDLTGKSVLLVLGGYLLTPIHNEFSKVADNEFRIDFANYPLLNRYFESSHYMDLSSLGLSSTPMNTEQISLAELTSDETLVKYMTLSQSFFVIVNTPELTVNTLHIKNDGIANQYTSYQEPQVPLVSGSGRMPEYWAEKDSGFPFWRTNSSTKGVQWGLHVYDDLIRTRLYNTVSTLTNGVSPATDTAPYDPQTHSAAFLMEICRDLKSIS